MPKTAAYPDGHVSTGEPVFQRLVPRLRVTFSYRLESELPVAASGRIALDARISDGRGWERTLPLAAERPFSNGGSTVSGVLDLERLQRITEEVRELTGSDQTAYTVAVLPRVDVAGRVGGEPVDATFSPALSFDAGDLRLQPSLQGAEGVGPFAPREPGSGTRVVPAEVSLGALSLSVATARRVSLLGIAALLLLGGLALAPGRRRQGGDEHERILARYGHLLLPGLVALGRLGARDRARRHGGARAARRAPGQADPPHHRGEATAPTSSRTGAPRTATACTRRSPSRRSCGRLPPATSTLVDEAREAGPLRRGWRGVRARADLGARSDELRACIERGARRQLDHGRPEEAEADLQRDHGDRDRHGRRQRRQRQRARPRHGRGRRQPARA